MVFIIPILIVLIAIYRCFLGVDFTDESQYVAFPYAFVLGVKPFIDIFEFQQGLGFILYLFVYLYTKVSGGTDGIVLFMRFVSIFLGLVVALFVYSFAKNYLKKNTAVLISTIPVIFMPYSIFAPGYQRIAMLSITLALFCGWYSYIKANWYFSVLSAIAFFIGGITYPTLFIMAFVYPTCFFAAKSHYHKFVKAKIGFSVTILFLFLFVSVFFIFRWKNIYYSYELFSLYGYKMDGINIVIKAFKIIIGLFSIRGWVYATFFCMTMFIAFLKRRWKDNFLPFIILSYCFMNFFIKDYTYISNTFFIRSSLLGLFIPFLTRTHNQKMLPGFVHLVIIPSIVAGMIMGLTSTSPRSLELGLFPLLLGTLIHCSLTAKIEIFLKNGASFLFKYGNLIVVFFLFMILNIQFHTVYRDGKGLIRNLTVRMESGPYSGIYTTPIKKSFNELVRNDYKRFEKKAKSILFFYDYPGFYLLGKLRPITPFIRFSFLHYQNAKKLVPYFQDSAHLPDLIFIFKTFIPAETLIDDNFLHNNPLKEFFFTRGVYSILLDSPFYVIIGKTSIFIN